MLFNKPTCKTLKNLIIFPSEKTIFSFLRHPHNPPYTYTQKFNYVDVYMKWKKDPYYDSIEQIHKSIVLKPIISLKDCISQEPNGGIPISDVSKRGIQLEVPMKVARFLRLYPSIFEVYWSTIVYPVQDPPACRALWLAVEFARCDCEGVPLLAVRNSNRLRIVRMENALRY